MIFLSGGPPHQDMVDLKMDAPAEIRGEFQPISTNVPGIQICEHLPRIAQRMDRLVTVRSLVGSEGRHAAFQCLTGWPVERQPAGGWPSFGSVVSKLQGPAQPGTPPFVSLTPQHEGRRLGGSGPAGFRRSGAFRRSRRTPRGGPISMLNGITIDTLSDRRTLMTQLDRLKREADVERRDRGGRRLSRSKRSRILTSSRLAEALDLDREDPRLRDRYGRGSPEPRATATRGR